LSKLDIPDAIKQGAVKAAEKPAAAQSPEPQPAPEADQKKPDQPKSEETKGNA